MLFSCLFLTFISFWSFGGQCHSKLNFRFRFENISIFEKKKIISKMPSLLYILSFLDQTTIIKLGVNNHKYVSFYPNNELFGQIRQLIWFSIFFALCLCHHLRSTRHFLFLLHKTTATKITTRNFRFIYFRINGLLFDCHVFNFSPFLFLYLQRNQFKLLFLVRKLSERIEKTSAKTTGWIYCAMDGKRERFGRENEWSPSCNAMVFSYF